MLRRIGTLTKHIGSVSLPPYAGHYSHYSASPLSPSLSEMGDVLVTMTGSGSVDLQKDEDSGIATITINNPKKSNALNGKMMVDLNTCVEELSSWQRGRGVILTGARKTFCSGGDKETESKIIADDILGEYMCRYMQAVSSRLLNMPLISVAAIDGYALAGGAELCTACDFRVMSETAKIGFIHAKLNIITGWGGGTRLVNIVGQTKALQILSSGNVMNAETASDAGLVSAVLHIQNGRSDFLEQVNHWLLEHCRGNVDTTCRIKQMVKGAVHLPNDAVLDNERKLFCEVWGKDAHVATLMKNVKHNDDTD